jgi:hypothetical protein
MGRSQKNRRATIKALINDSITYVSGLLSCSPKLDLEMLFVTVKTRPFGSARTQAVSQWSRHVLALGFCAAFFASLCATVSYATDASPQYFTYQGYLTDSGGNPLTGTQTLVLAVYDPSDTCLLYEEDQSVDLTSTTGLFSIQVGSQTGDPKRVVGTDPGISMATVFSNSAASAIVPHGSNCALSSGYTPVAGDGRLLRLTVSGTTLSPDQAMGSLPQAVVAQSLQGQAPMDFVQVTGNSSAYSIAQADWDLLFGTGGGVPAGTNPVNASSLHHHDDRYLQIGSITAQNMGSGGFYSSGTGSVGTISAPLGTQFEVQDTTASSVGEIIKGASSQTADLFEVQNSSGTVLDKIDSSGNLWIGGSEAVTQSYISGSYLPLSGGTLTGPLSGTSFTSTLQGGFNLSPYGTSPGNTGEIHFSELSANGSKYVGFRAPNSISNDQIWVLPAADGTAQQVLTTDGSGNLSWSSSSSGSVTAVTATSPLSSTGGNTPQLSITQATSVASGYLSSSDWLIFNGKVAGASNLTTSGSLPYVSASGTLSQNSAVTVGTTANVTNLILKAGSAQSTTDLTDWENNSSAILYSLNSTGTPTASTDLMTKAAVTSAITSSGSGYLQVSNNLSDVASASSARTNLGLGTAATQASTAFDAAGAASTAQGLSLQKANNLSDVANATTALTNLLPSQISASGLVLESNGTNASWQAIPVGFTNPMTTLGDLIYENSTPAANRLPGNVTTTKKFLTQTGTGTVSAAPAWSTLASSDIPNNAANTSGTAANLSGTPALPSGTAATTQAAGDTSTDLATDAFVMTAVGTVVADTTITIGTTAVGANTCTSASTVTMTNLTATMAFSMSPQVDVSAITGWGATGGLVIDAWPTTNTLNYKVCNQTGSSITPSSSVTFNVSAR